MTTILHIEDDEHVAKIAHHYLEREGFNVVNARTAHEGIELARQLQPKVIIMDIWLPGGLSGWEAIQIIRQTEELAHIRIIALTAQGGLRAQQQAHDLGCDAYLAKPLDMRQLTTCVRYVLAKDSGS